MCDISEKLIELGKCFFISDLDNYFLSMLIAKQIDLMDEDEEDTYDPEIVEQLNSLWIGKFEDIFNLHKYMNDSYNPPYRDSLRRDPKNMPFEWYTYLMEKTPPNCSIKDISTKYKKNTIQSIINHAKLKLLVLQHFDGLSPDFNNQTCPLNTIVYQNIERQISDWTECVNTFLK
tara:strand:- start:10116 stop:10640 length:525 start_codon:yes stop_codon:yes gene_type:complete